MRATSLVLALLAGIGLGAAPARADQSDRLERIRAEIEARESRARDFAEEAEGYLGELEGIDRELAETRRSLSLLRGRQRAAEEELMAARAELREAERARARIERDLKVRLVALYKFRSTGGLHALSSARDFQSYSRLGRGLARILEEDTRLFARYREAAESWDRSRSRAEALVAELAAAGGEIARREERARNKLVERRNLVALLRSRADRERRAAEELREAAARLEQALRRLPAGAVPVAGPGLVRSRVPAPVVGAVRLGFGRQLDPEYGTETLRNGVEFAAAPGAPVRAVAPGRVLFAGWFRGYGQVVILDHGKGSMTVSGYLAEVVVEAGDSVQTGQSIGTVGETGSLSGPGLYFEIRRNGEAVDPRNWLE